tara:strand:+ start:129 stop:356 length:228 start_codon:yes stop_codon:yes gene_type:complete
VELLHNDGFDVTTENSMGTLLLPHKRGKGIPQPMHSCHTGEIGGYMIDRHVPLADIRRLLAKRPDAVALAVPGMP